MLLFTTILPVKSGVTPEDFIKLILTWNEEASRQENVLPGIVWKGERSIRYGGGSLSLTLRELAGEGISAARHEKRDPDGTLWHSDFIFSVKERRLSVSLARTYSLRTLETDRAFSTPHFISLLIREGFLERDAGFEIARKPLSVQAKEGEKLALILNGEVKEHLPFVLVTRTESGQEPLDCSLLASRLKGAAHVLVESAGAPSILRKALGEPREPWGGVRIIFPKGRMKNRRFVFRSLQGNADSRLEKTVRAVISYWMLRPMPALLCWQGVLNAILTEQIRRQLSNLELAENARKRAEDETERLYETFDRDLSELEEKVSELTGDNESLRLENAILRQRLSFGESMPLLCMGEEEEFFEGEMREMILSVLRESLAALQEGSRRRDLVLDVLSNNPPGQILEQKRSAVKKLLKGYRAFTPAMRAGFASLGFESSETGKHVKLCLHGDPRYMITVAKTPTDGRSGSNNAAMILRKML